MTNSKNATTYHEQLELLARRGCVIDDIDFCLDKLSCINYYRLTAYLLPYKRGEKYIGEITFSKLYDIYEFDRRLRNILYGILEVIEVAFKTRLSYLHAHKYGSLGYLDKNTFNPRHNHNKFLENINLEINRNHKQLFVKHHMEKYDGKFPIWVISELFTFGMVSYFYSDLTTQDQKEIAKDLGINYKDLRSWLRCLTDLRNICAHTGRLYYRIFTAMPAGLNLLEEEKRRLWGIMLVLKMVYPSVDQWNLEILPNINGLFEQYGQSINLDHIAFPSDWYEQLKKNH